MLWTSVYITTATYTLYKSCPTGNMTLDLPGKTVASGECAKGYNIQLILYMVNELSTKSLSLFPEAGALLRAGLMGNWFAP